MVVGLAQTVYTHSIFVLFCAKIFKYTGYIYGFGQPYMANHIVGARESKRLGVRTGAGTGLCSKEGCSTTQANAGCHVHI